MKSIITFGFTAVSALAFCSHSRCALFRPSVPLFVGAKVPVIDEVCKTTGITLKQFMSEVSLVNPELTELTTLFGAIETSCKAIATLVKRSQLPSSATLMGAKDEDNQMVLNDITNDLLKESLRNTGRLGVLASEEEDSPMKLDSPDPVWPLIDEGERYVAVIDLLDGSSHIDAGIPTGTIVGIYQQDEECINMEEECIGNDCSEQEARCLANTLQPATNLVAAAYCLYSSCTFLVLTLGNGTFGFTLDEESGEFVLSRPDIQIPETCSILSFNEANAHMWDEPLQQVISRWKTSKTFSSRYIGSATADVHRTLLYGGVFGYPADERNPNGKLRLLYESAPMSFIVEQAGGLSTTGKERLLDIEPEMVHQRVPVIMGSRKQVEEIIAAYASAD